MPRDVRDASVSASGCGERVRGGVVDQQRLAGAHRLDELGILGDREREPRQRLRIARRDHERVIRALDVRDQRRALEAERRRR